MTSNAVFISVDAPDTLDSPSPPHPLPCPGVIPLSHALAAGLEMIQVDPTRTCDMHAGRDVLFYPWMALYPVVSYDIPFQRLDMQLCFVMSVMGAHQH